VAVEAAKVGCGWPGRGDKTGGGAFRKTEGDDRGKRGPRLDQLGRSHLGLKRKIGGKNHLGRLAGRGLRNRSGWKKTLGKGGGGRWGGLKIEKRRGAAGGGKSLVQNKMKQRQVM